MTCNPLDLLDAYLKGAGVRHFTAKELCPVGRRAGGAGPALQMVPESLWPNIVPTLLVLDALRDEIGAPLIVSSAYRDPAYNKAVGGASASLHMRFSAVDFTSPGLASLNLARRLLKHPEAARMGIGLYAGFVHADSRGLLKMVAPARWAGVGLGKWWA